jgi:hypothetical protein
MILNLEMRIYPTEKDLKTVLFVVEQGFATVEQLWRVGFSHQKNVSYTYDRVLLLERAGYLKKSLVGAPFKVVQATSKGRNLVLGLTTHPLPTTSPSKDIAYHQLELNELRLLLACNGINSWRAAESLILDPDFRKIGQRHVPDGFYLSSQGVRTAVEYDRTLRSKERIKERFLGYLAELMAPDRSFDRLIYLVEDSLIKTYRTLFAQAFEGLKDRSILMPLSEFKAQLRGGKHGQR